MINAACAIQLCCHQVGLAATIVITDRHRCDWSHVHQVRPALGKLAVALADSYHVVDVASACWYGHLSLRTADRGGYLQVQLDLVTDADDIRQIHLSYLPFVLVIKARPILCIRVACHAFILLLLDRLLGYGCYRLRSWRVHVVSCSSVIFTATALVGRHTYSDYQQEYDDCDGSWNSA